MRRWLLERFQQGVEGARRKHVDLVNDVDLEARLRRRVGYGVDDELAHLVDLRIRRRIKFDHIQTTTFCDIRTDGITRIKTSIGTTGGIKRLSKNAGRAGLARTARSD